VELSLASSLNSSACRETKDTRVAVRGVNLECRFMEIPNENVRTSAARKLHYREAEYPAIDGNRAHALEGRTAE